MFSFLILVGVVLAVGLLFFQVVKPFLFPLFFAGVLAILFRPAYEQAVDLCKGRARIAAALTTFLVLMMVLLPLGGALALAGTQLFEFGVEFVEDFRPNQDPALTRRMEQIEQALSTDSDQWEQLRAAIEALETETSEPEPDLAPRVAGYLEELRSEYRDEELIRYVKPPSLRIAFGLDTFPFVPKVFDRVDNWLTEKQLRSVQESVWQSLQGLSSQIYTSTIALAKNLLIFLVGLFIVALALYYFFAEGPRILESLQQIVPIDAQYQQELYRQFETVCRAVVLATLTSAFAQGLLGGVGYAVAGVPGVWLLMLLTMVTAMIPVGGAALVWLPVALWLFFHEQSFLAGGLMFVYGVGVISAVDNLIKPFVIQGRAKLHPLLVFVSVLGALRVIGLWGIFVGPIVAAVFYSLLKILHAELNREGAAGGLLTMNDASAPKTDLRPKPSTSEIAGTKEGSPSEEIEPTETGAAKTAQGKPSLEGRSQGEAP